MHSLACKNWSQKRWPLTAAAYILCFLPPPPPKFLDPLLRWKYLFKWALNSSAKDICILKSWSISFNLGWLDLY